MGFVLSDLSDLLTSGGITTTIYQGFMPPTPVEAIQLVVSGGFEPVRAFASTAGEGIVVERPTVQIVRRSADILGIEIDDTAARAIAGRSRFTPRTANYFLKRCRDFAQIARDTLTKDVVIKALDLLEVDVEGLTSLDRAILRTIIEKFGGGVGLDGMEQKVYLD